MPRTLPHRLALLTLAVCTVVLSVVGLSAGTAWAHNTLETTDPADGAVLAAAPAEITWTFTKEVPLETMTVTLIDAAGVRSELSGSVHGAAGNTVVVTPLPALQSGPISLRWRLVGPDGHPITGRVDFTVNAATPTTVTALDPAAATTPTTTVPVQDASVGDADDSFSTPTAVRWVLRYASYMAIMAAVGILLTTALIWSGAGTNPLLQRILSRALLATAGLGLLQLLVVASDVRGAAPWSSFGSISAATTTDAGMAFAIRVALALAMWVVIFQARIVHSDVYWTAVSLPGLGLLATWAYAGHSRSMRWPAIGVVTDVAHHAAAAAWIAGLAIVGWIVIPKPDSDVVVPAVRSFSRIAAISVGVLVATGFVQTIRLVGSPLSILDATHGRLLAIKLIVLAIMLGLASSNRRRLNERLVNPATMGRHAADLRQPIITEFAIGLVIVAITAAMVVSPPSSSAAPLPSDPSFILHDVVVDLERLT